MSQPSACIISETLLERHTRVGGSREKERKWPENERKRPENVGLPPLQKIVGDFCCINFGGFCRGFSWRVFLGTFSHKNEEKRSGDKIREKIFFCYMADAQ